MSLGVPVIPLCVVLSYVVGLWFGPFLSFFPLAIFLAWLGIALILIWLSRRRSIDFRVGLVCIIISLGGLGQAHWISLDRLDPPLLKFSSKSPVEIHGVIVEPIRHLPQGMIAILHVDGVTHKGEAGDISGTVRLTWREPDLPLFYGDRISLRARIREPYGTLNPGGFHYGRYLKHKGIDAVASIRGGGKLQKLPPNSEPVHRLFLGIVDSWRHRIYQAALSSLSNPALGLFLGMILGEQTFIDNEIRDAFMITGTVHILSISGSHLGILALSIFVGVRMLLKVLPGRWVEKWSCILPSSRLAIVLVIPVVTFYTLLAGAEIATVRSWIMIVIGSLGAWLGREREIFLALGIAALLLLIPHPEWVHDLSFQLSFLSVIGIGLVVWNQRRAGPEAEIREPEGHTLHPLWKRFWAESRMAFKVTVVVSLLTLPLVVHHFHQIPWMGVFTNFLVVPAVGFIVVPMGLLSGLGALISEGAVLPFSELIQWLFSSFATLILKLSQFPGGAWFVKSPGVASMLCFWMVLGGVLLWKRSGVGRTMALIGLLGLLAWWGWSPRSDWEPGILRVTFLDVGQGDATLLELPGGETVLIDGGPAYRRLDMGRAVIGPYLWNRGVYRLDHILATHPQWDHVGGLPWVIRNFDVGHYWSNGISRSRTFFDRLQQTLKDEKVRESALKAGDEILDSPSCSLTVLSPEAREDFGQLSNRATMRGSVLNNHSLVTKLVCGPHSFLFTADAEKGALEDLRRHPEGSSARVVKIPHHGAKSSLHRGWIRQIQTEALVVSAGKHNRYGHPADEVLSAYYEQGFPLYRTDRDGAIIVEASLLSSSLHIRTAGQQEWAPVSLGEQTWTDEWENWRRTWRFML